MAKLGLKKLFTLNRDFCAPRGWKGLSLLYYSKYRKWAIRNMAMKPERSESGRETRRNELLGVLYHFGSNERENAKHAE